MSENLVKELIEKMKTWKQRNDQKRCAICGKPLPHIVADASYQHTPITKEVNLILTFWNKIPEPLREWLMTNGIAVCTEHLVL